MQRLLDLGFALALACLLLWMVGCSRDKGTDVVAPHIEPTPVPYVRISVERDSLLYLTGDTAWTSIVIQAGIKTGELDSPAVGVVVQTSLSDTGIGLLQFGFPELSDTTDGNGRIYLTYCAWNAAFTPRGAPQGNPPDENAPTLFVAQTNIGHADTVRATWLDVTAKKTIASGLYTLWNPVAILHLDHRFIRLDDSIRFSFYFRQPNNTPWICHAIECFANDGWFRNLCIDSAFVFTIDWRAYTPGVYFLGGRCNDIADSAMVTVLP
jgi:hypothetical protein